MKKIIYLAVLLSAMAVNAQTFQWLETPDVDLDLNPSMVGYSVANDPSGNVYLTGFKNEPYAYNDIMGNLYYNKYDANGQLLFSKEISGKACNHNMVSDSQGNILMALGYVATITIDDVTITTIEQGDHFVLAKFDPQGNLLWHKPLISPEESTWISQFDAIAIDAQDNIYIGYDTFGTSFIDKYSPDGNKLMGIVQEHANSLSSVSVDNEGNIYAAGACANEMATYAGVHVPSPFQYNTYIVKYSPEGVYQWLNYVEDITCPRAKVVARTPDEVYFSSYLFGAYAFGPFTAEGPVGTFEDFFLAKLDADGNYQWVREVPGEGKVAPGNRNSLAMDSDGNVYLAGYTGGNINWGNGISSQSPAMGEGVFLLKYNPQGNVVMAKTAGGEGYDRADGIAINSNGDIYISGMANGNVAFDNLSHNAGQFDTYPYLTKLSSGTMGVNQPEADDTFLYPNPASDIIYLSGSSEKVQGTIINMLGQEVAAFETDGTSPIRINGLPAGTYIVKTEMFPALRFVKK